MKLSMYLRSLARNYSPRVHANGFIQIDISRAVRLHIWGDGRIPRQHPATPIHNHAFDFTSRVLIGALRQNCYHVAPLTVDAEFAAETVIYRPYRARIRSGEDTTLAPDGAEVVATLTSSTTVPVDSCSAVYAMARGEFHETVPLAPSVSVIVKTGLTLSQGGVSPTVLVPRGVAPDNDFNRHAFAPAMLFKIIDGIVGIDPQRVATGIAWALGVENDRHTRALGAIAQMTADQAEGDAAHVASVGLGVSDPTHILEYYSPTKGRSV